MSVDDWKLHSRGTIADIRPNAEEQGIIGHNEAIGT